MSNLIGQTLGDFVVVEQLGAGGMGQVFKARQPALNRFVALKVMSNALAEDREFIERFKREATTAAQFKHPNIVQVFAAGESNGTHYMAMEFVEGRTLREHIRSHGRLDPQEAIAITLHVAEGLKYAWNKSRMIHRDIKPDNVFLSQSGEVLVGDLGLAKTTGNDSTELTASGAMMGSPHYISPEQAMAVKDIDFRADIYSLGCTLYHMLTGRTAYEGDSSMVLMMKHVQEPPPDIFEALPECPRKLGVMVARMMAKNRDDRPPSYEELIAGLWEASENLSGETEIGRPPSAQPLSPTAVGQIAAVPTVAATPRKRISPGMIYSVVGTAVVLLLAGLMIGSPWKSSSTTHAPLDTSGADDAVWNNAINLLPLVDPQKDAIKGQWSFKNGELESARVDGFPRLQLPYQPPQEYDFRIAFTRRSNQGIIYQVLTGGGRPFDYSIAVSAGQQAGRYAGFEAIRGQNAGIGPSAATLEAELVNGRRYTSLVQVRKGGVKAFLDGQLMTGWKTDYQDMMVVPAMRLHNDRLLGIGNTSDTVFHRIEVREVTGKGTFTRGAPSAPSNTPQLQHSAASSSAALQLLGNVFTNSVGAEMVYIPPGEFMLGSTKEEQEWAIAIDGVSRIYVKCEGEQQRKTTIKQGFWLGRTEVTVGPWRQFVNATGYVTDGEKIGVSITTLGHPESWGPVTGANWKDPNFGFKLNDNHPASCISWNDAVAFCEWLTEREQRNGRLPLGYKVRLPTEAEWEYACRAGTQTKFWWGESTEDGKERLNWGVIGGGLGHTSTVDHYGLRGRNNFHLSDMLGNVWEWCLDGFDTKGAHEQFWTGNSDQRVVRGGAFKGARAGRYRCAFREPFVRSVSEGGNGFRLCVGVDPSLATGRATTPQAATLPPVASRSATAPKETGILAPPEIRVSALTTNPKVGEVFTLTVGSNVTMELMGIPPGEFMLGSTKEEQAWAVANGINEEFAKREGEAPRKATIKVGFWLGRTEATVGQWKQFVKETAYVTDGEKKGESHVPQGAGMLKKGASWRYQDVGFEMRDDHAVSCISWNDAMAFCKWLTERGRKAGRLPVGMAVRLPTEAEWEYACRAGTQTKFWWGDSPEEARGRLNQTGKEDGFEFVAPADGFGLRGRNRWGLADMLGNVYEWCLDEFDATQAHEDLWTGNPRWRVLRGGSFTRNLGCCRCANRYGSGAPADSNGIFGFRVCVGVVR